MDGVKLLEGDCLAILPTLEAGSVDAVITDPPYMVGAISVGNHNAKCGTWADMENSAYWFAAWMKECKRLLKPTGHLACFGNWRSLPTLIRALSLCGMPATSCIVWDKEWIGPAGPAQFRPVWELIVTSAMSVATIEDRSQPDLMRHKWMASRCSKHGHPAEKPAQLVADLVRLMSHPGGTILDPFAGSGTTGLAALQEGRRAILIEREPAYCEIIRRRLAQHEPLFAAAEESRR
jgi:DNA modification methylase